MSLKRVFALAVVFVLLTACSGSSVTAKSAADIGGWLLTNQADNFPAMTEPGQAIAELAIDADLSALAGSWFFAWQSVSVELGELIIIIPKDDEQAGKVKSALALRLSRYFLSATDGFYPEQRTLAGTARAGNHKGCYYLICSENVETVEKELKDYLDQK